MLCADRLDLRHRLGRAYRVLLLEDKEKDKGTMSLAAPLGTAPAAFGLERSWYPIKTRTEPRGNVGERTPGGLGDRGRESESELCYA
jgi:hypothetical protein